MKHNPAMRLFRRRAVRIAAVAMLGSGIALGAVVMFGPKGEAQTGGVRCPAINRCPDLLTGTQTPPAQFPALPRGATAPTKWPPR
ncbi:MAG: hypothetical protein U0531_03570 [Dehalococcoidia bacterium]